MAKRSKIIPVRVRMTRELHAKLQRDAKRNGQTLNAEILKCIEVAHRATPTLEGLSELTKNLREILSEIEIKKHAPKSAKEIEEYNRQIEKDEEHYKNLERIQQWADEKRGDKS